MVRPWQGPHGDGLLGDDRGRPFQPDSSRPQQVIAQTLAERDGWAQITPRHWRDAAAVVKALRERGLLAGRTNPPPQKDAP